MSRAEVARRGGAPRHSTPWHMCSLFSLVLLLCCACGTAHSLFGPGSENTFQLFVSDELKETGEAGDLHHLKYDNPFVEPVLVSGDGVMVALTAKNSDETDAKKRVHVVAMSTGTQDRDWVENAIQESGDHWRTAMLSRVIDKTQYHMAPRAVSGVVADGKIYLLTAYEWGFLRPEGIRRDDALEVTVGKITHSAQGGEIIEWQPADITRLVHAERELKMGSLDAPIHRGSPALATKGAVLFFMNAKSKGGEIVSTIIRLNTTKGAKRGELLYVGTAEDCYSPSFFGWGEKVMMVPAGCPGGPRSVKESTDMGKTWTDATGPFSGLWDHLKDKRGFTPVTIENKSVLLYIEQRSMEGDIEGNDSSYLWVTNGTCASPVKRIGPSFIHFDSSLLYTKDELFFLHNDLNGAPAATFLTHLAGMSQDIKSAINSWDELGKCLLTPEDVNPGDLREPPRLPEDQEEEDDFEETQ